MELIELIRKLKRKLTKYKKLYSQNEAAVREHIVSPLLRALKWDPEDPKQVIPEHSVPVKGEENKARRGKEKRIKLDYALMRRGALFTAIEVKALGKVDKGLGKTFLSAQATGARYIIITDGDTWRLYDTSKPLKEALISEWSLLRESSKEIASKAQIIANIKNFGSREALIPKLQKCPHCNYEGSLKLLKTWKYSLWNVYYYECPKCGRRFRYYADPEGKRKSYIIPVAKRKKKLRS